jgi:hypothetical protein
MVRRATVDRSPQSAVHNAGYDTVAADAAPGAGAAGRRTSGTWRGAGGRWLVWLLRGIAWLVVLMIGYNGVVAIVTRETASPAPAPAAASGGTGFPASLAQAYAYRFGEVYLNASPATAAQRASQLAAFLPPGTDPQLGWNGTGALRLEFEHVAGIRVTDARHAVVTLLAQVNGHLMELGVPVYSDGRGLAVSGEPAWLAAPPRAAVPSSSVTTSDSVTQAVLMNQLPSFFQAYASGNQVTLARFLAPGTSISGLGGQVAFGSLTGLTVPPGGTTRDISATVLWRVPGPPAQAGRPAAGSAGIEVSYALRVEKSGGTWYVQGISPSNQPTGPP